jgi:hypothetical protein
MRARVRLSFARGRLVFRLPQHGNLRRWYILHRDKPNWSAVFTGVLRLLDMEATASSQSLKLAGDAGEVTWHSRRCGTTINVQLLRFSERKQKLLAAALLKAARNF